MELQLWDGRDSVSLHRWVRRTWAETTSHPQWCMMSMYYERKTILVIQDDWDVGVVCYCSTPQPVLTRTHTYHSCNFTFACVIFSLTYGSSLLGDGRCTRIWDLGNEQGKQSPLLLWSFVLVRETDHKQIKQRPTWKQVMCKLESRGFPTEGWVSAEWGPAIPEAGLQEVGLRVGSGGEDKVVEAVGEGSRSHRTLGHLGKSWDFILGVMGSSGKVLSTDMIRCNSLKKDHSGCCCENRLERKGGKDSSQEVG